MYTWYILVVTRGWRVWNKHTCERRSRPQYERRQQPGEQKKKKKRHRRLGAWTTRSGRASSTEYYFVFIFNSYSYEYIVVLVIVSEDSIIRYISYPTCLALLPLLPSTSPWMLRRYRRESLNLIKYRNSLHYFGLFYRCCIYTNMDQTRFSFETRHYSIPVYTKHKKTYPIRMKLPTA